MTEEDRDATEGTNGMICDVWLDNFYQAFEEIEEKVKDFNYVSMVSILIN